MPHDDAATTAGRSPIESSPATVVVRCACRSCGAHLNAALGDHRSTRCPNCTAVGVEPVPGAKPLSLV